MSAAAASPPGPDFEKGILASEVQEEPFFGHCCDRPVFLLRRGGEIYAYDAVCTHYGAPLAEGIVVEGTIRCPWHHARFSLEDGTVEGGPAFDLLRRRAVSIESGTVRVRGHMAQDPLQPRVRPPRKPDNVVIVGAGAAGANAAETLRREGYEGPVKLLDPDPDAPYDRPNLSKAYLAGEAPEDWIPLRSRELFERHNIQRLITRAVAVDLDNHLLTLEGGERIPFDALLLAPGSRPRRFPVPGSDGPHVHTLRSLSDSRAIIEKAKETHEAVVIGASFIGLEVASSLRARGLAVTVVALEAVPFEKALGPELGAFVQSLHEEHGVRFELEMEIEEIRENSVLLGNGSEISAGLVVVGIGVEPELELARDAGLQVKDGIVVDEFLRTSHIDVYAAGDAALFPEPRLGRPVRIEHWVVAGRQGRTAARNILGMEEAFHDEPFFWTRHFGKSIAYVGHGDDWDEAVKTGACEDGGCSVVFRKGGRRLALGTVSRNVESLRVEWEMEHEVD